MAAFIFEMWEEEVTTDAVKKKKKAQLNFEHFKCRMWAGIGV